MASPKRYIKDDAPDRAVHVAGRIILDLEAKPLKDTQIWRPIEGK
jgi:hypothetical protein